MNDGFSEFEQLQSHTPEQTENGEFKAPHAMAVGRLPIEVDEVLAQALSVECRRHTADYVRNKEVADD